jgi:hypothetical protein
MLIPLDTKPIETWKAWQHSLQSREVYEKKQLRLESRGNKRLIEKTMLLKSGGLFSWLGGGVAQKKGAPK